jgi:hypothetical protein
LRLDDGQFELRPLSPARPRLALFVRSLSIRRSAVDSVIAEVIEKGVSAEELDRSKNRMIADAVYAQDNQGTLARWYGRR